MLTTVEANKKEDGNLLEGRKILVVDDDRLNIRILQGMLKGEGYAVFEATTGEQALEVYQMQHPDLVLLDVMLPGINGFETCRRLKSSYGDDCAPIIFITAKSQSDDVLEGFAAGGIDYLPKPFQAREVAARIRTHLENRRLVEAQRALVEQLSNANAAKNRFLGMAAHDLRNPLAGIRGLAEFMIEGAVGEIPAEQLDLLKNIHAASQSMLELVNELLDISAIESGELKLSLRELDLGEVIAKSVYLANIEAGKKGSRIDFTLPEHRRSMRLDAEKMKQVVDNLLSNAIKYSPPGSVVIVDCICTAGSAGFSVKDQGPGIPENERDRLFKDFSRLSVKPTGGEKSTGLGLAICRKIVEAHGATITATNLPAGGCEFRVTFPL
ncbi:MAG: hybrid sensor histidine kinase/response regulator [Opitutaceae bacterium]|nr:hybrid sensor histidine kinase/response regulator [Opitutaceae bacterium]